MFEWMEARAQLIAAMARRLEVDVPAACANGGAERYGSMARTCMVCRDVEACRAWLGRGVVDEAYRHFCPNADRFDLLRTYADREPRTAA
ncbi:DUF6455 family protein [Azospirillum sp. ST 5-10]|uniref:DUF6455 family protein n=1 Tax=unclassified Azospirillum TaxID=2630922 RepID=UPI003F49B89E